MTTIAKNRPISHDIHRLTKENFEREQLFKKLQAKTKESHAHFETDNYVTENEMREHLDDSIAYDLKAIQTVETLNNTPPQGTAS